MHFASKFRTAMLAGCAIGLVATPAIAQDGGEEEDGNVIIVTATKRDSTIQDVPFSINAQTEADIQRSGAVTLEELSRNVRSEEHTSELQSLMRISYAVFCLKKKKTQT